MATAAIIAFKFGDWAILMIIPSSPSNGLSPKNKNREIIARIIRIGKGNLAIIAFILFIFNLLLFTISKRPTTVNKEIPKRGGGRGQNQAENVAPVELAGYKIKNSLIDS